MQKRLIVNADDFGRSPGVSQGILEAHQKGIVTSTTVMINQPGIELQLSAALDCPALGIGLHLVFTGLRPVLPPETIPSLVREDGRFFDHHTLWARSEVVSTDHLREELTSQVEQFGLLVGRPPDHLDCHHFVHLYPPFFQVYADLAFRFRLPLRVPFPPETDFRLAARSLPFLEGFPPDIVRGMIVTNSACLKSRQLTHPDRFIPSFFGQKSLTLRTLLPILDTLPPGTCELMCHPGYDEPALAASSYRRERETELALLTEPAVQERVKHLGIELATYGALERRRPTAPDQLPASE
jgi:predicted glycoside hydrolase/deacetylase ChbG (UPF0249 family)